MIPLLIERERAALRELKETRAARHVSAMMMCMLVLMYVMMPYASLHAQAAAKKAGYHSPTSMESPEKIYASPSEDSPSEDEGEYEDEPPPRRELTAAEKREFEEEIDALSSHSSDPEGPEDPGDTRGKSIEEITAWCIQYERKQKMERIARQQAGIEGMHAIKLH